MLANYEEKQWVWNGEKFAAVPGQFVTSSASMSIAARVSRQSVRTALVNLKKLDFLTYESTKTGILITVTNWALYQSDEENQPTSQPTSNQRSTTTKKVRKKEENIYSEVLAYLNEKTGSKFRAIDAHKKFISARSAEGFSLEDFKTVIDKKSAEWVGTDMQMYLRPSTLFGTKFDSYLNAQAKLPVKLPGQKEDKIPWATQT